MFLNAFITILSHKDTFYKDLNTVIEMLNSFKGLTVLWGRFTKTPFSYIFILYNYLH